MYNGFVLRNISGGADALHPYDKLVFIRDITFDSNGEAVITNLGIRPGATINYILMNRTTTAIEKTTTWGDSNATVEIGEVGVAVAAETDTPANVIPAASTSVTALIIVNGSDIATL